MPSHIWDDDIIDHARLLVKLFFSILGKFFSRLGFYIEIPVNLCYDTVNERSVNRMSNISYRLLTAWQDTGLTLAQLEERTGIPKSSIQRYTSATTKAIPAEKLIRLADALHVPTDFIMGTRAFTDWDSVSADRKGFLFAAKEVLGTDVFDVYANRLYDLYPETPEKASVSDLTYFIYDNFDSVEATVGGWKLVKTLRAYKEAPGSTEGLSPDRQALIDLVLRASDEEVRVLRGIVDQVLSLRGK